MMSYRKLLYLIILLAGIPLPVLGEVTESACGGPSALISLVNRPTIGDSSCVVPYKEAVLELGYQYVKLTSRGYQHDLPEAELRIGLPLGNEFVALLPNYIHQSLAPHSGNEATMVGIKHSLGYTQIWAAAVEALFTLPSGSADFGSKSLGTALNGIFSYNLSSQFTLTGMVGLTSQTLPRHSGGQRFTSFNPDITFSWLPKYWMEVYAEVYGQTKSAPGQGSGFNMDTGLIFLPIPTITIDFEVGQRISGVLGGFNRYVGTGMAINF
jgi:hypothetical protein